MKLACGYSPFSHPENGMGPFDDLFTESTNLLRQDSLKNIDAVILWGGADISPTLYAEEPILGSGPKEPTKRDLFELEVCREAHKKGIPIIGICRGAQFICAFAGGKLIQHVNGHSRNHLIHTNDGRTFDVTSSHHQMLFPYDVDHELLAWSSEHRSDRYDGLTAGYTLKDKIYQEPEVVYFPEVNGFAVQCHPEWHFSGHPFNKWMIDKINEHCFNKVVA